jgi:hypothetical protein
MLFRTATRPTAQEAASRALCLGALTTRAELEDAIRANPQPEVRLKCAEINERLTTWAANEGVSRKYTGHESRLLGIPLGEWTPKEVAPALTRVEAAAALLWALNRLQLPPLPKSADRATVLQRLHLFESVHDFVNFAALRGQAEVDAARHAAAIWHWRARAQGWVKHPERARPGGNIAAAVRSAALTAYTKGHAPAPLDDDLPAFGKPYRALDDAEFAEASSSAFERHYALSWLAGQSEDWEQVSTDTERLFRI